jgi:hypothetical protein
MTLTGYSRTPASATPLECGFASVLCSTSSAAGVKIGTVGTKIWAVYVKNRTVNVINLCVDVESRSVDTESLAIDAKSLAVDAKNSAVNDESWTVGCAGVVAVKFLASAGRCSASDILPLTA